MKCVYVHMYVYTYVPLFCLLEGYHAEHPVILNFWKAVEYLDNEQRLRLLQVGAGGGGGW